MLVHANVAGAEGQLRLEMPAGWKAVPATQAFKIPTAGEEREVTFDITPPAGLVMSGQMFMHAAPQRRRDDLSSCRPREVTLLPNNTRSHIFAEQ